MKKVFLMGDTCSYAEYPEILCAGLSVAAVIKKTIEMGYIVGDCFIMPDSSMQKYHLEEYLKDWKESLPLLTQNEFNSWFKSQDLEIIDLPLVD